MLGRLGWDAIPFDEPIAMAAGGGAGLAVLVVLAIVTKNGWWPYLWKEWLTSVDHKRIGVMYTLLALVMLLRGFTDAIMMRSQQAIAIGGAEGYLPPDHYNQIFSAHGAIMIFFVAMPFVVGLMNFVVPLQLGVRDVAFPVLNSVSFWLTASGSLLINLSLVIGNFARTGWLVYPPLSESAFSPSVGVDYYLWSLQISGVGTLLTGINFTTTILKLRAPGMGYGRMGNAGMGYQGMGYGGGGGAGRGGGGAVLAACGSDIQRLCAGVQPGEGRIRQCMRARMREVSPQCINAAMASRGGAR